MYQLYVKQKVFKLRDVYPVLDEDGRTVYRVEQDFRLIGNTVHVYHVSGQRSFVIDRELLRLLPRYQVSFDDGGTMVIRQRLSFLRKQIDVSSRDYQLHLQGDFFLDLNFDIYNGSTQVGFIKKAFLAWGDTFVIGVMDPAFEEELLALLIVVDDILDMEAKHNNHSS